MSEIGFRFYCLPYTKELLEAKARECGLDWNKYEIEVEAMIDRFHGAGIFAVRVLDDINAQYCMAAFVEKKNLDADLAVSFDEDGNSKLVCAAEHKIRILSSQAVQAIMQKDLGIKWVVAEKPLAKLLDHLYGNRLYVACADAANAQALRAQLALIDLDDEVRGVDLRFRIHH